MNIHAFTSVYNHISNVLTNSVYVSPSIIAIQAKGLAPGSDCSEYKAAWDTGATRSVITERVVRECSMSPIGVIEVHGIGGPKRVNQYLIDIWLPNKVIMNSVEVAEGQLKNIDVLIGMDIIIRGDFAVTNHNGKTVFSYRSPSVECIDFVSKPFKPKPTLSIPKLKTR